MTWYTGETQGRVGRILQSLALAHQVLTIILAYFRVQQLKMAIWDFLLPCTLLSRDCPSVGLFLTFRDPRHSQLHTPKTMELRGSSMKEIRLFHNLHQISMLQVGEIR